MTLTDILGAIIVAGLAGAGGTIVGLLRQWRHESTVAIGEIARLVARWLDQQDEERFEIFARIAALEGKSIPMRRQRRSRVWDVVESDLPRDTKEKIIAEEEG